MEPVSIVIGIVLGVLLTFVVLALIGYRKKKQMEKMMESLFGGDLFSSLDNIGALFPLPDAEPEPVGRVKQRRPIKDAPQA